MYGRRKKATLVVQSGQEKLTFVTKVKLDRKGDKIKAPGVSLLYDTPNQNVLLEFQKIACLSMSQELVYYQSLW